MAVATFGLGSLVAEGLSESPRAIGGVLTVLGVAIALVVGQRARRQADIDGASPTDAAPPSAEPPSTGGFGAPWAPPPPPEPSAPATPF